MYIYIYTLVGIWAEPAGIARIQVMPRLREVPSTLLPGGETRRREAFVPRRCGVVSPQCKLSNPERAMRERLVVVLTFAQSESGGLTTQGG